MLSSRGERCTAPSLPYWGAFARALADPYSATLNPTGAIPLCVAENKLPEPHALLTARLAAPRILLSGVLGYDDMRGRTSLRNAFAALATRRLTGGARVDPTHLTIAAGCGALIAALASTLLDDGDAVLLPTPTYGALYNDFTVLAGVKVVDVPRPIGADKIPGTGALDSVTLDAALDGARARGLRVRALFIINPDNPTGAVIPRAAMQTQIKWAREHNLHVIVDEIYALSEWGNKIEEEIHSFTSAAALLAAANPNPASLYLGDDVHVLWGFSKDFAASGLRTGVLFSHNQRLNDSLSNIGYFMTVANDTQDILASIVADDAWIDVFLNANHAALQRAHASVVDVLSTLRIPFARATSGMFVWFSLREFFDIIDDVGKNEEEDRDHQVAAERAINEALWFEQKLVFTPGEACHATESGWFRICFAWPHEEGALQEALRRLGVFVAKRRR